MLNWVHSFVLELVADSRCKFWGFGICKVGYIGHEYAIFAGMLGINLTAYFILFLFYLQGGFSLA